jgi:hypothetical protein
MNGTRLPPVIDGRRRAELLAAMRRLVAVLLPDWRSGAQQGDVADALLATVASIETEVTKRLDRVPEKQFRNFLDWIGLRRGPARAAQLFAVLIAAPTANATVLALARLRLQAQLPSGQVIFETDQDLLVVPGSVADLIAVDGAGDKIYLPPSGLLTPAAPASVPLLRALAAPAGANARTVQVTPSLGLDTGQSIGIGWAEYHVTAANGDLITIDPPLVAAAPAGDPVAPVPSLIPFPPGASGDVAAHDWQHHALYIGATDLLNIESDASIILYGGDALSPADPTWSYWGQPASGGDPAWLPVDAKTGAGMLTLTKHTAGAFIPTAVSGRTSRWLRATVAAPSELIELSDGMRLSVQAQPATDTRQVTVVALSNTVPLVTTTQFFPFGREPRLFDQFYLSAPEAMSKKNAVVTFDFNAADESLGPLVPAPGAAFSVRNDGVLLQVAVTAAGVQRSAPMSPTIGAQATQVLLDPSRPPSVAIYQPGFAFLTIAVVSQDQRIWIWGGGNFFGDGYQQAVWSSVDAPTGTLGPVAAAKTADGGVALLVAIGNTLYTRRVGLWGSSAASSSWSGGTPINGPSAITRIAVARQPSAQQDEMIALVRDDHSLWVMNGPNDTPSSVQGVTVDPLVEPTAIRTAAGGHLIVAADTNGHPIAIDPASPNDPPTLDRAVAVDDGYGGVGVLIDPDSGNTVVLFRPTDSGNVLVSRSLVVWPVGGAAAPDEPITQETDLRGAPIAVQALTSSGSPGRIVVLVPGSNRAIYHRDWSAPAQAISIRAANLNGAVRVQLAPLSPADATEGSQLLENQPNTAQSSLYPVDAVMATGSDHIYRAARALPSSVGSTWRLLIPKVAVHTGSLAGDVLTLDVGDSASKGDVVLIWEGAPTTDFDNAFAFTLDPFAVTLNPASPGSGSNPITATLAPSPTGRISSATPFYQHVRTSSGSATGALLTTLTGLSAEELTAAKARGISSNGNPSHQGVLSSPDDSFVVLQSPWSALPTVSGGHLTLQIPGETAATWVADQKPVDVNPELSWEYWDGSSWLRLSAADGTHNLLQSGNVVFTVPTELKPTDVAGQTEPWIRARLIGGDYGKSVYKLNSAGDASQTAELDTSQLHPPRMLGLTATYTLLDAVAPDFLLTDDNRAVRDQSAANRLSGAIITVFQPVTSMLQAFGPNDLAAGSRALFLGIQAGAAPADGVVRFLALVREQTTQVRIIAETLRDGGFVELPLGDDTLGLSQNGLLSVAVDAPLQITSLFGAERYWLRLRPRPDDPALATWQPALLGLYLNGVSAAAAQTQDLEILGSSDGSPNLSVTLARSPILAGSLDLRVLEPLSDEDIAALRVGDPDRVRTDLQGRPGAWVRWTEISDVADADPGERAYQLDPATGDITFGDAKTGLVPPVGANNIIALTYRVVGSSVANQITAWAALTLVTTVQGVESVVAPVPAAGGADPETDAMAFAQAPSALRDRGRAITGDDLEAIALANAPELSQARFIQSGRSARLIVVASGPDPRPDNAQRAAVRARLAAVTLPRLAAVGGLSVNPPSLRPLAIAASLMVESFDVGSTVEAAVRTALDQLLDASTGGLDGSGWPLGVQATAADLMAVLVDIDGLLDVTGLTISDVDATGALTTPPVAFSADELATLAPDRLVLILSVPS